RGKKFWWVVPLCLCSGVLLSFYPSLFSDFQMEWDDQWMVFQNPMLTYSTIGDFWYSFIYFFHGQYSPLNQLYYYGIYILAGFDPTAYHLGSLIIHVVNSILVYRLIFGLSSIISDQSNTNRKVGFALASALIFAIHPLQVESVAWISASKVLLYTTFTLLGMLSYLRYKNHAKYRYLLLTFLCYVGSLLV